MHALVNITIYILSNVYFIFPKISTLPWNNELTFTMDNLPKYASVLTVESEEFNHTAFFRALSQLDARDNILLSEFMDKYQGTSLRLLGLSDSLRFVHAPLNEDSSTFDQFSVDLWKEYYVQEDIIQIALLQDKEPEEVSQIFPFIQIF